MTKNKYFLIAFVFLTLASCKSDKHEFPLDKRYWDTEDYQNVIRELRFNYKEDEKKPTFDDPQLRMVVQKLTDEQNFKVVLDDNELGLKHRNDAAGAFFEIWKDMNQVYQTTDRKDKYVYDKEMLAVWHFGLGLQLDYFRLGNEQLIESADDPNSYRVRNSTKSNVATLIGNYNIYLDEINNENSFSEVGKQKLADGIDKYFTELIKLYPNSNYRGMKNKMELMLKKSASSEIKSALTRVIEFMNSKKIEKDGTS
jgi:hypothetical protein